MLLEEVRQVNWEDVLPETEDVNLNIRIISQILLIGMNLYINYQRKKFGY
jgi:hypothetical protein